MIAKMLLSSSLWIISLFSIGTILLLIFCKYDNNNVGLLVVVNAFSFHVINRRTKVTMKTNDDFSTVKYKANNNNKNNYDNILQRQHRHVFRGGWNNNNNNRCQDMIYFQKQPNRDYYYPANTAASSTSLFTCAVTCENNIPDDSSSLSDNIIPYGIMLSSFTDGLKSSHCIIAQNYVRNVLLKCIVQEYQNTIEQKLEESAKFSPCNGPNIQVMDELEQIDTLLKQLDTQINSSFQQNTSTNRMSKIINNDKDDNEINAGLISTIIKKSLPLRFLYIPTAMYALRCDSKNTPGKQRQRARADAKQRRDDIVQLLIQQLLLYFPVDSINSIPIHVATLDLDDGSVKQPEIILSTTERYSYQPPPTNRKRNKIKKDDDDFNYKTVVSGGEKKNIFPTNGKEALQDWKPHLLYIQGGNTFWLYYCIEKGEWKDDIRNLLQYGNTLYCGVSAGAIIAGTWLETACWKQYDDPSVVPGKEQYDDWKGIKGLQLLGQKGQSFFPHYNETLWGELVHRKKQELRQRQIPINSHISSTTTDTSTVSYTSPTDDEVDDQFVCCLKEEDAYLINGNIQQSYKVSSMSS